MNGIHAGRYRRAGRAREIRRNNRDNQARIVKQTILLKNIRLMRILIMVKERFNRKLNDYRNNHEGTWPISLEMPNIYRRSNDPLNYVPYIVMFNFLALYINDFVNFEENQQENLQPRSFQPLKLLYDEKSTPFVVVNEVKEINVRLPYINGAYDGTKIHLIKIKNIISCYDLNYEMILKKLGEKNKIEMKEEVTVQELGSYQYDIDIPLNINDNSNEFSYLLVFTNDDKVRGISEIIQVIGPKQYIQRSTEDAYLLKLIERRMFSRFLYYMDVHLRNINEFKQEFKYGIHIKNCMNRDGDIVFDRNNFIINNNTEAETARERLRNLRELINLFINNDINGPFPEGNQEGIPEYLPEGNQEGIQEGNQIIQNGVPHFQEGNPENNIHVALPVDPLQLQPFQNAIPPVDPLQLQPFENAVPPVDPLQLQPFENAVPPVDPLQLQPFQNLIPPVDQLQLQPFQNLIHPVDQLQLQPLQNLIHPVDQLQLQPFQNLIPPVDQLQLQSFQNLIHPVDQLQLQPFQNPVHPVDPLQLQPFQNLIHPVDQLQLQPFQNDDPLN